MSLVTAAAATAPLVLAMNVRRSVVTLSLTPR